MGRRHVLAAAAATAVLAVAATTVAVANPDSDPFVGSWHALDVDDSHQFFFIEEEIDGVYSVLYYDTETNACAGQMWSGLGVDAGENSIAIEFGTRYCLEPEPGPRNPLWPWEFTYDAETDTVSSTLLGPNSATRVNTKDIAAAQKDITQGKFSP